MQDLKIKEKGASSEIRKWGYELTLPGIESWLRSLNILASEEQLRNYSDCTNWTKTGSETYGTRFKINYLSNQSPALIEKEIFLKALISTPIDKMLKDWSRRRSIMRNYDIPVSNWYFAGDGIIIEDYYPHKIDISENFTSLLDIGYKIDRLGFNCLNFLADIRRTNGNNLAYIDFGFDLGEPIYLEEWTCLKQLANEMPAKREQINTYLENYGYKPLLSKNLN